MPDINRLLDHKFGPYRLDVTPELVAEYVDATGDNPKRWTDVAPPGLFSAAFFQAAPDFFGHPDAADLAQSVIHVDQHCRWLHPTPIGAHWSVTGRMTAVRQRSRLFFVSFAVDIADGMGEPLLESTATLLMTDGPAPAELQAERKEMKWQKRKENHVPPFTEVPILKSASREDLVRYLAVTKDFNPIHWDHQAARKAGLPGIVNHGLLGSAWLLQAVGEREVTEARFRYRSPVSPNQQAEIAVAVGDGGWHKVSLTVDKETAITADILVNSE
jgi:acyl dehydratase